MSGISAGASSSGLPNEYVESDILELLRVVTDKPLRWLAGEIKTPPFSTSARIEAGVLLRRRRLREYDGG
jgi:hypothetical protein